MRIAEIVIHAWEIGLIEHVEKFSTELRSHAFRKVRILDEANVPHLLPGTNEIMTLRMRQSL